MDDPGDSGKRDGLSCFSSFCLPPFPNTIASFFLSFKIYVFIFGCAGPPSLCARLSLVAASGGSSFFMVHGRLILVASLVVEHGHSRHMDFSSCSVWAQQL